MQFSALLQGQLAGTSHALVCKSSFVALLFENCKKSSGRIVSWCFMGIDCIRNEALLMYNNGVKIVKMHVNRCILGHLY